MFTSQTFLSSQERDQIVAAIHEAEEKSPGEIKVYFERHCKIDVLDRAVQVFAKLKLNETKLQTGILIYVAYADKMFAILGDKGINEVVPANFWDETKTIMENDFKEGRFGDGLVKGIKLSGEALRKYYKPMDENKNEISDDIVIGDE
jgi:uncharacterized membrane protein